MSWWLVDNIGPICYIKSEPCYGMRWTRKAGAANELQLVAGQARSFVGRVSCRSFMADDVQFRAAAAASIQFHSTPLLVVLSRAR